MVAVSTTVSGWLSATAQAEAYDLELLGGVVTASIVSRTATSTAQGRPLRRQRPWTSSSATARSATVKGEKTYKFDGGTVVVNRRGAGLTVTLTSEVRGLPGRTKVVVADVSASAAARVATPEPTATRDGRPPSRPRRDATGADRDAAAARGRPATRSG